MQAQLIFNLPDDQEEYNLCNNAQEMKLALHNIQQYLRGKVKYETSDEVRWEAYDEIYQQFYVILNEHDIKL